MKRGQLPPGSKGLHQVPGVSYVPFRRALDTWEPGGHTGWGSLLGFGPGKGRDGMAWCVESRPNHWALKTPFLLSVDLGLQAACLSVTGEFIRNEEEAEKNRRGSSTEAWQERNSEGGPVLRKEGVRGGVKRRGGLGLTYPTRSRGV